MEMYPRRILLVVVVVAAVAVSLVLGDDSDSDYSVRGRRRQQQKKPRQYEDFDSDEEGTPYSFQYEVDAPYHGTWHDRQEKSSGSKTEGQFRVALPDHRLQTVTYQASAKKGFQADVQFQHHPDFQTLRGNIGKAPVIGSPVVSASVSSSEEKPSSAYSDIMKFKPQEPSYIFQASVGNRLVSKQPFIPIRTRTKTTRRPLSVFHQSEEIYKIRPSVISQKKKVTPRPSYPPPHKSSSSTPLSAFVSIGSINKLTTYKPSRTIRPVKHFQFPRHSTSSKSINKNVVPSRPLRNKQRSTIRPSLSLEKASPHQFVPITASFASQRVTTKPPPIVGHQPIISTKTIVKVSATPAPQNSLTTQDVPVSHFPKKEEPKGIVKPPATTDESFSISGKETRYAIRREAMHSIRSRLNSIVHD